MPRSLAQTQTGMSELRPAAKALLIVGGTIFAFAMLGLASRHAFSVSFWPANAVLAGLLVRRPQLHRPAGWLGAGIGFAAADLCFGRTAGLAGAFALTNLIGVLPTVVLLRGLDPRDLMLARVHSVMRITGCILPGCVSAGLAGAVLVKVQFDGSMLQALATWPASELVNYLTALPAVLTLTSTAPWIGRVRRTTPWPAIALAGSCVAAAVLDGPGCIMFPMPALLLCALTYSVRSTSLLTMALGAAGMTAIGLNLIHLGQDMANPAHVVSIRVAVAFLVLVPLTISSAMAVHDRLLDKLRDAADHDGLTGLLNRRAFDQRMRDALAAMRGPGGLAVLWLDIDHFKSINDRFGHPAGDAVLQSFGALATDACGEGGFAARMGGEEFALVLAVPHHAAARRAADRLRRAFAAQTTEWSGIAIRATVSIGACYLDQPPADTEGLVRRLDELLYRAKRTGRDRIEWLHAREAAREVA
jgi:diguanylate cyclase (GGDEF)-like protein